MTAGVYLITNTITGERYVGQSNNIQRRWTSHTTDLRCGTHNNYKMQEAYGRYGLECFSFEVLEEVPADRSLTQAEGRFIRELRPEYNVIREAPDKPRERVEAWVDTEYVNAIDALPTTRTKFIAEAIREKLERQRSEGVE